MSLINDALKRAKEAQQPAIPPRPVAARLPAITAVDLDSRHAVRLPRITIAIIVVIACTVLAQWLWLRTARAPRQTPVPQNGVVTAAGTVSQAPLSKALSSPEVDTVTGPAADIVHVSSIQEPPPAQADPVPVPGEREPALFKLQAIIYSPAHPSAMIDGQTLFVGDSFKRFKVIRITADAVTLQGPTGTTVLRLQ